MNFVKINSKRTFFLLMATIHTKVLLMTGIWNNYNEFVNNNGFIIFDDYNDSVYSPQVKNAVQDIVKNIDTNKYEIIGDLKTIIII